ncbi:MAG: hypothetical protein ACNA8W_10185 [Bradymonadaceae bacterium]
MKRWEAQYTDMRLFYVFMVAVPVVLVISTVATFVGPQLLLQLADESPLWVKGLFSIVIPAIGVGVFKYTTKPR